MSLVTVHTLVLTSTIQVRGLCRDKGFKRAIFLDVGFERIKLLRAYIALIPGKRVYFTVGLLWTTGLQPFVGASLYPV